MKNKKNMFFGATLLAVLGITTMAYAMPQEFSKVLPIEGVLSSIVKSFDKQSTIPTQADSTKQTVSTDSALVGTTGGKDEAKDIKTSKIPEPVVYLFLFRQVAAFEEKAAEVESRGENGAAYRTVFKRTANLTEEQSEALRKAAVDCAAEVKVKDEAAKIIGDRIRAELQSQMAKGVEPVFSPSAELTQLQKERDEIILKYRDSLKDNLGDEAFARFESYVQSQITSNITTNSQSKTDEVPVNMDRINNPQAHPEPAEKSITEDK